MVSLEKDHCQRFYFDLHRDIQLYLVTHNTTNFDELVGKAKAIEEIKASQTEVGAGKQVFEGASKRDHDS